MVIILGCLLPYSKLQAVECWKRVLSPLLIHMEWYFPWKPVTGHFDQCENGGALYMYSVGQAVTADVQLSFWSVILWLVTRVRSRRMQQLLGIILIGDAVISGRWCAIETRWR